MFIYLVISPFLFYFLIRWLLEKISIGDLHKKAIFITGCDTGFGHALVLRCLENNMPVFAGCLTEEGKSVLKKKSANLPGKLDVFLLDVSSDESVNNAKNYITEKTKQYGGLHGVVNNAGIVGCAFYDDFLTIGDYKKAAEVNLWGVIRVTQAVKDLVKQTKGRIVTTTSVLGRIGFPNLGPYTVTKFGANGYCDVIRQELRMWNVSVHILEPGLFRTPLITGEKRSAVTVWERASPELKEAYGEEIFEAGKDATETLMTKTGSDDVTWVVDSYFHALTARFPRVRYQPGWDSQFLYIPFSMLPSGVQDSIIILAENICGRTVPAKLKSQ